MILRILWRLFLAAVACVVLLVTCVGAAVFLAFRPPAYYPELVAKQPPAVEVKAAQQRMEQMRRDFLQWRARSLALQKGQDIAAARGGLGLLNRAAGNAPEQDAYTFRVSEADLNTLLASNASAWAAERSATRGSDSTRGQVVLALTVETPAGAFVLSAGFIPRPTADDGARLQITRVSIGRLPLPMATLASLLPREEWRLDGDLYFDATDKLPDLVLRPGGNIREVARTRSIKCNKGELVVQLGCSDTVERLGPPFRAHERLAFAV